MKKGNRVSLLVYERGMINGHPRVLDRRKRVTGMVTNVRQERVSDTRWVEVLTVHVDPGQGNVLELQVYVLELRDGVKLLK